MLSTVIKVSSRSKIRLRNTKAYRAISWNELNYFVDNLNENINTIIIDGLADDEYDKLLDINSRSKEFNIPVVVYSEEQQIDEKLSSVCSENNIDTAVGLNNLQELLANKFSVDVLTSGLLHTENKVIEENNDVSMDLFDESSTEEESTVVESIDTEKNEQANKDIADIIKAISANEDAASNEDEEEEDIEISETIKSKHDIESFNIESLFEDTESDNKDKDTVVLSEDIQKELEEKDKIIEDTSNRLENTLNRLKIVNNLKSVIEAEKNELVSRLEKIALDKDVTEVTFGDSSKDEYEARIAELNKTIDELNIQVSDIEQLNQRINQLSEVIKKKESEQKELEKKIEVLENNDSELNKYKSKFKDENEARKKFASILVEVSNKAIKNKELLDSKVTEYNNLLKESMALQDNYTSLQGEMVELQGTLAEKDGKIKEVARKYEKKIEQMVATSNNTINKLETEKNEISSKFVQLQGKFREVSSKLIEANKKLTDLQSLDLASLDTENNILGKTNDAMLGEIGVYQKRLNDAQVKINSQESRIGNLSSQVEELKRTNESIMRASRFNSEITFECDYTGRASILYVCGSGSVGVTNTAASLCSILKGKILLLDLDIVSPKANEYLSKMAGVETNLSPMSKTLPDFTAESAIYMTGLGTFLYKDIDYFIDNEKLLIKNVLRTRDGKVLDYISGVYAKPSINMLMAADFTQFLTYLGNKYDYIVCDCGRVGGSEVQSAIQRMLDGICFKKILVARHDGNDMRSLTLRLSSEKLSKSKAIWLLNLSRSNEMTTLMNKCLSKAPYIIFPYTDVIFGKSITFDKVRVMNSKLDELNKLVARGI